ncbi:MAG: PrsW family intramembrane metalloprotease [Rhizobacter sp.]|nr:PrsW family intramembrane metalloprotease [Chlorobiales bacterium]
MPLILFALALAPGLAIAAFVYFKDKLDKEPMHLLVKCFLLGALCTIPAIIVQVAAEAAFGEPAGWLGFALDAFIIVALSEELSKYWVLKGFAYKKPEFNEPYDGIVYGVMAAMGFATLENIGYVLEGGLSVAILRLFLSVPGHAVDGVMMGYYVGLAKFTSPELARGLRIRGILTAVLFHGLWDFSLFTHNAVLIIGVGLVSFIYGVRLSLKAIHTHTTNSPFGKPSAASGTPTVL